VENKAILTQKCPICLCITGIYVLRGLNRQTMEIYDSECIFVCLSTFCVYLAVLFFAVWVCVCVRACVLMRTGRKISASLNFVRISGGRLRRRRFPSLPVPRLGGQQCVYFNGQRSSEISCGTCSRILCASKGRMIGNKVLKRILDVTCKRVEKGTQVVALWCFLVTRCFLLG
jgi:ribosomal protein S27E